MDHKSCNQIYTTSKSCITSAKPFQSQNLTTHHCVIMTARACSKNIFKNHYMDHKSKHCKLSRGVTLYLLAILVIPDVRV